MNKFEIRRVEPPIDREHFSPGSTQFFDFFIDGEQLSKAMGVDRFDLAYCSFDLDYWLPEQYKNDEFDYNGSILPWIRGALGLEPAFNQFDSGRVALYRCHCGCDYCGIISCKVIVEGEHVFWRDLRYESEFDMDDEDVRPIAELVFNVEAYRRELAAHCERCGLDAPDSL